jgi:O-antigen ligase
MPRRHRFQHQHRPIPLPVAQPREAAPRLHPLEKTLLAVVAAHLVFLPWALGTMHVWSQVVSFGFSVLGFGLALRSRLYSEDYTGGEPFRLHTLPKLLRFPIFWLGLLFLLYILVQALNPAWEYVSNDRFWWLQGVPCIDWLPTGMRTPFAEANPWRALMIYSSAWMTVCAIWIGFTRRKSLRILLVMLAVNAFLLALFGLIERALNADKIFWLWKPPAGYFVASFIYRNHAGAYFNLLLAVTCGLAFWYHRRQIRRMEQSSPAVVFGFFAAVVAAIVLYSYSRGAALLMCGFLALVAVTYGRKALMSSEPGRPPLVTVVLAVLFLAFAGIGLVTLKTDVFTARFETYSRDFEDVSKNARIVATQATWEMAQDNLLTGWGAGSFRFYFPVYQLRHPELIIAGDSHKRMLWQHAHDDYLELLAEVGALGCALLVTGFLVYLAKLIRLRFWRHPLAAILLGGCFVTMLHATFDFPFFNPAILITWCVLWPVMVRWLEIEQDRRRAAPPPLVGSRQ